MGAGVYSFASPPLPGPLVTLQSNSMEGGAAAKAWPDPSHIVAASDIAHAVRRITDRRLLHLHACIKASSLHASFSPASTSPLHFQLRLERVYPITSNRLSHAGIVKT